MRESVKKALNHPDFDGMNKGVLYFDIYEIMALAADLRLSKIKLKYKYCNVLNLIEKSLMFAKNTLFLKKFFA